jgi:hypothetical protein
VKWQKTYGGRRWDEANAVAIAPNGDIIVAGYTDSFGAGTGDVWLLRLPPSGSLPGCDICHDSDAEVKTSDARVTVPDITVETSYASVENTEAIVENTSAEVSTQCEINASEVSTPTGSFPEGLSKGLVAHYPFDHCDARDDSGNGHDGEIHGNPKCVEGVKGRALYFDGENDWIEVEDSSDLMLTSFTLAFWAKINPDSEKYQNDWVIWLGKSGLGDDCYGDNANYLVFSKDGYLYAGFEREAYSCYGVDNDEFIKIGLDRLRGWNLVVLTYDSSTRRLVLYLNDTPVGSLDTEGGPELNDQPLAIARNALYGFYDDKLFKGALDEIFLYNRALTQEEVRKLYAFTSGKLNNSSASPSTPRKAPSEESPKRKSSKWGICGPAIVVGLAIIPLIFRRKTS